MSVVTAVAALAAIGLLFAMDPGGAIAESGFPDFSGCPLSLKNPNMGNPGIYSICRVGQELSPLSEGSHVHGDSFSGSQSSRQEVRCQK